MQIQINEDVRITSDRHNIIVEYRKIAKEGKSAGIERWEADSYHGNIEQAVMHVHQQNTQFTNADSIDKLIVLIEKSKSEIINALLEHQHHEATNNEMVTIPKAVYDRLVKDSEFLACLEGAGVDNWDGYDDARASMQEE